MPNASRRFTLRDARIHPSSLSPLPDGLLDVGFCGGRKEERHGRNGWPLQECFCIGPFRNGGCIGSSCIFLQSNWEAVPS